MAHYDIDVHCDKCRKYCFSCMPDKCPEFHVCTDCREKKPQTTKKNRGKTAFEETQEQLRPLAEMLIAIEKEDQKKGGYNLDHLLERRRRLDKLIDHVSEIAKKLKRPPQDLRELILCAVSIEPLACQEMTEIAQSFGFKCSTDVKFAMMGLARIGKAQFNDRWQLTHV